MEFVETSLFTQRITKLLRKLRWRVAGRGKRGGLRIIYYCWSQDRLYMIFVYDKAEQGDLTPEQLKVLRAYVKGGV